MISRAKIKYLMVSPRKLRLILPLIKKKTVPTALYILENMNKKAARLVYKAVKSAAANAKRFPNINEDSLYVSKIFADGGPMLKRYRARSMGMANTIKKRTTHLTVELDALVKKVGKVSAKGGSASGRKKVNPSTKLRVNPEQSRGIKKALKEKK